MDRSFRSDDMSAERRQDAIDADREAHGYRCLHCGETDMTEDQFVMHECPEDDEPDADTEDARQDAYWNAEAARYHPDADAMADREADRWERGLWRD